MFLYSLFPLYVAFPRAEYYHEFRLLACLLSPFGFAYRVGHTRTARACKVSPVRYDFAFRHAVLSDSAAVSRTLAYVGFVLLPSRVLKTVGPRILLVTKLHHFTPQGYIRRWLARRHATLQRV